MVDEDVGRTLDLSMSDIDFIAHLCETAHSFLFGQLVSNQVPAEHVAQLQRACERARHLIDRLRSVTPLENKHERY